MHHNKEIKDLINMTEQEAYTNAQNDKEAQPLSSSQLSSFVPLSNLAGETLLERLHNLKKRETKKSITVRYDADILEYYKSKGKGYQQAMNNALRACMEAEKGLMH